MSKSQFPATKDAADRGEVSHGPAIWKTDDLNYRDIISALVRRRWIFLSVVLFGFAVGVLFTLTRRPVFEATAQLVVGQKQSATANADPTDILTSLQSSVGNRSTATQVEIINGEGLSRAVASQLSADDWAAGLKSKPSISIPQWTHTAEAKTETELITITTKAYDPAVAAKLANMIARTYLQRDLSHNKIATQNAAAYVDRSRKKIESGMRVAAKKLAEYQVRSNLLDTQIQTAELAKGLIQAQSGVDLVRSDVEAGKRQVMSLETQIRATGHEIKSRYTLEQTPEFLRSQQRLSDISAKLRLDQSEFAPGAPELQSDESELKAEKKNLQGITERAVALEERAANPVYAQLIGEHAVAKALLAGNENRLASTEHALEGHFREFHAIPVKAEGLEGVKMQFEELKSTFDLLTAKYYALQIEEEQSLPNGQLETPAIKPESPTSPNKPIYLLLALVFSIIGATIGVAVAERIDTRIHDPETIDRITGLVPIGMIPKVVADDKKSPFLVIGSVQPDHAFLESYRLLRHNIGFAAPDKQLRVLSLTSSSASEGKTTCVFNLAIAFAMDGKRVLIVDADLRRPSVHKWTKLSRETGLTSVVRGTVKLQDAIQLTQYDGVSCLTSGPLPPNPTEFLNTSHFQAVLAEAKGLYDIVLVDAPPCTGMSDAVVISTLVDAMLLVVVLDETQKHFLGVTTRMLTQAGAPLLGTVLNRMPDNRRGAYYYYYYYNYYYAYGGVNYGLDESEVQPGEKATKTGKRRGQNKTK